MQHDLREMRRKHEIRRLITLTSRVIEDLQNGRFENAEMNIVMLIDDFHVWISRRQENETINNELLRILVLLLFYLQENHLGLYYIRKIHDIIVHIYHE